MGRTIEYVVALERYMIDNKAIMEGNGELERHDIKLLSAKGLHFVSCSDSMDNAYERILKGEETGWTLSEIWIKWDSIILKCDRLPMESEDEKSHYDPEFHDHIYIGTAKDVVLEFEIDRGEGAIPDYLRIDCTFDKQSYVPGKVCSPYRPRVLEVLNGGRERRTLTFREGTRHNTHYTVSEERY